MCSNERKTEVYAVSHDIVFTQDEDGWIVAECPELPGCVSQGKDEVEAIANIREAIVGWLWAKVQKSAESRP